MPYCFRKMSECHLLDITLIWENLSGGPTQFVSTHCVVHIMELISMGMYIHVKER